MSTPDVILRLAARRGREPAFLEAHHVEASMRLVMLFERARLRQRVTMSYDPARVGGGNGGAPMQVELADGAADAHRRLTGLARAMPSECWSVLFDVCGLERGLQDVELAQGWPRRGGKLVLRIALDQLAAQFGLAAQAEGRQTGRARHWLPERPVMFG